MPSSRLASPPPPSQPLPRHEIGPRPRRGPLEVALLCRRSQHHHFIIRPSHPLLCPPIQIHAAAPHPYSLPPDSRLAPPLPLPPSHASPLYHALAWWIQWRVPRAARSRAVAAMATRPALRQRKVSPAAAARSSPPQQPPQSGSPTSTTTTTTSSSRLTPDLSLDGPASPLFAGLDEDPVPKENVTVTVRFRPRSLREIRQGEEVAWYADGDTVVRSEQNPNVAYAYVGHRRRQWWFLAASRALRKIVTLSWKLAGYPH